MISIVLFIDLKYYMIQTNMMIVSWEKPHFNLSIKKDNATSNKLKPSSASLFFLAVNNAIFERYRLIIQTNDKLLDPVKSQVYLVNRIQFSFQQRKIKPNKMRRRWR